MGVDCGCIQYSCGPELGTRWEFAEKLPWLYRRGDREETRRGVG
jgi:hypothetical protein